MEQRLKFIAAYLESEEDAFIDLCDRFEIARSKGYKWIERYKHGGVEALADRSRRPHTNSRAIAPSLVHLLLDARSRHPTWGPRKLIALLSRKYPRLELPAASTVGDILRRNGLVATRRRRRAGRRQPDHLGSFDEPNGIWCADFKGWFLVGGSRCSPLTISDGFSRYLLSCTAMRTTLTRPVSRLFEAAFQQYGLPKAIRTDNGPPCVSVTTGGLSRLSVWWIKLGIRPERILPGRPDQNGRHERMHRTLAAEAVRPARQSFPAQQRAFNAFMDEYNNVRPHEALDQQPPASLYRSSSRTYHPHRLADPEYPSNFHVERAYPNGVITFAQTQWYLSTCLAGELVGIETVEDGCWRVHFGPVPLGLIDVRRRIHRNQRNFGMLVQLADGRSRRRLRRAGR